MNKQWYVLQVLTGKEGDVKSKIIREFEHFREEQRPKLLVPVREVPERRQGRVCLVTRPLFPGYVFLNVVLDNAAYYTIKQIPYIIRFLGVSKPFPVPMEQMKPILRMCNLGETIQISKVILGKTIEVVQGPLKGFKGNIVSVDKRKGRAKVRFKILNEVKEIDLGIEVIDLQPAENN